MLCVLCVVVGSCLLLVVGVRCYVLLVLDGCCCVLVVVVVVGGCCCCCVLLCGVVWCRLLSFVVG